MNEFININNQSYEIYLSSNGVIKIEDLLDSSLMNINLENLGFKTIIVLLCGCLYQKNKLTLNQTADLFDDIIESQLYSIESLVNIIKNEINRWSEKLKKNNENQNDKKK